MMKEQKSPSSYSDDGETSEGELKREGTYLSRADPMCHDLRGHWQKEAREIKEQIRVI
jgi:hypothetical protein